MLAIVGAMKVAIVSLTPRHEQPLSKLREWRDGLLPFPKSPPSMPPPAQRTQTESAAYQPMTEADPHPRRKVMKSPSAWLKSYLEDDPARAVIVERRSP